MRKITFIDAPSILGLQPTIVERLPEALKAAGIVERLGAGYSVKLLRHLTTLNEMRERYCLMPTR